MGMREREKIEDQIGGMIIRQGGEGKEYRKRVYKYWLQKCQMFSGYGR